MGHRVAREVEVDLDDVWLYVATESGNMDVATRLVESITARFCFLASFPWAGRSRDQDFGIGMRSFPVGEYVVVYCVESDDVLVLRVVHGKRDLEDQPGQ